MPTDIGAEAWSGVCAGLDESIGPDEATPVIGAILCTLDTLGTDYLKAASHSDASCDYALAGRSAVTTGVGGTGPDAVEHSM